MKKTKKVILTITLTFIVILIKHKLEYLKLECQNDNCVSSNFTSCTFYKVKEFTMSKKKAYILEHMCINAFNVNRLNTVLLKSNRIHDTTQILHGFKVQIFQNQSLKQNNYSDQMIIFSNTYKGAMYNLHHFFKDFIVDFYSLMRKLNITSTVRKRCNILFFSYLFVQYCTTYLYIGIYHLDIYIVELFFLL